MGDERGGGGHQGPKDISCILQPGPFFHLVTSKSLVTFFIFKLLQSGVMDHPKSVFLFLGFLAFIEREVVNVVKDRNLTHGE